MKYYEIWTIVEPKRKALSQATMEYTAASNKLTALNEKIDVKYGDLSKVPDSWKNLLLSNNCKFYRL
jgi:hypothetical protein